MESIKAFAPATIANFNVGFDVLGLSLNNIGDEVELTLNGSENNRIVAIVNGAQLPTAVEENCCSVVIRKMQEALGEFKGVDISITKGFRAGSGLGSSSASSAAAAFAYNALVGEPFSLKELVCFAAEGERIACGSPHIDNVAPAILGGIVLSLGKAAQDIIALPVPQDLYAISLFPKIKINTSDARKTLKNAVPLSTVAKQVGYMGAFVASLYKQDLELFSSALQDLIIEPARSLLIPKFQEMKQAAMDNNALAFGISGSGPAVFAIANGEAHAQQVLNALNAVYSNVGVEYQTYVNLLISESGARLIQ
tara:strand:- start:5775 stop:6704 length:930 start_codon:yes stop_codon:yes gene_type:complete